MKSETIKKENKIKISAIKLKKQKKSPKGTRKTATKEFEGNTYLNEFNELRKTIPGWEDIYNSDKTSQDDRLIALTRLDVIGSHLCDKYAWAVPDARALRILKEFSPLIEIGCGKGYWANLLRNENVDIIAADLYVDRKTTFTAVVEDGPSILDNPEMNKRTLFLCYPDETELLGSSCLEKYTGEYVIHIGEMITTGGTKSGSVQAPFGRTTSSDFQIELATDFHCLLIANIPRYPFSNDTISVWKRSKYVEGLPLDDVSNNDRSSSENESADETPQQENLWISIPENEILPVERAAPCLQHLLQ